MKLDGYVCVCLNKYCSITNTYTSTYKAQQRNTYEYNTILSAILEMKTHHDARSVVLTGFTLFPFTVPQTYTYIYIHILLLLILLLLLLLLFFSIHSCFSFIFLCCCFLFCNFCMNKYDITEIELQFIFHAEHILWTFNNGSTAFQ